MSKIFKILCQILLILNLIIRNATGQNCQIPAMGQLFDIGFYALGEIEPKFVGKIKDFETKNIESLKIVSGNDKYWSATISENVLSVFTLEKFKDYEMEMSAKEMTLYLDFKCEEGHKGLEILINIKDVNNYAPIFNKNEYNIEIPTPLPKGFDISHVMTDEIIVTDYDLYDSITIKIAETSLFSPEIHQLTQKTYQIKLITTQQIILLNQDLTFALTAKDRGGKLGSAVISISTNSSNQFVDKLKFSLPLYEGKLFENFTLDFPEIVLEGDFVDSSVQFEWEEGFEQYFKLTKSERNSLILQVSDKDLSEFLNDLFIKFLVTATTEGDHASCVIFLNIITKNRQQAPMFEKFFYEFNDFYDYFIRFEEESFSSDIGVEYSGDHSDLFEFHQEGRSIFFSLKNDVNVNDQDVLNFNVLARRLNGLSASTAVIVHINHPKISVKKTNYERIYIENEDFGAIEIQLESYDRKLHKIDLLLEGKGSQYFKASLDPSSGLVTVELSELHQIDFSLKNLAFILKIVNSRQNQVLTISIMIHLEGNTHVLKFEKSLYEGVIDSNLNVKMEIIKLKWRPVLDEVTIVLSGPDSNKIKLKDSFVGLEVELHDFVTVNELSAKPYLSFTVTVSQDWISDETNVILKVPKFKLLFSKSNYFGSIDNGLNLKMEELYVISENWVFSADMRGSDSKYFGFEKNENKINLKLLDDFPLNLFQNQTILKFEVWVGLEDQLGVATVIITLPPVKREKYLEFEKTFYTGKLEDILEEKIYLKLENYDESVKFYLEGRDASEFQLIIEKNKLSLLHSNSSETLDSVIYIFEIRATRDNFVDAKALVVLEKSYSLEQLQGFYFEHVYYKGSIYDGLHIDPITVLPQSDKILDLNIQFKGEDSRHFDYDFNSESQKIILKLKETIPHKKFYYFYIEASKFGGIVASTAVIVDRIQQENLPSFDKIVFEGEVTGNSFKSPIISYPKELVGADFALRDGNSSLFELVVSDYLSVTPPTNIFDKNLWKNNAFLSFYVTARKDGYIPSHTFVLIRGDRVLSENCSFNPQPDDPQQPYFKTGYYSIVISADTEGVVGVLNAFVEDKLAEIVYELDIWNENLKGMMVIDEDTGKISVRKGIEVGQYNIIGVASNIIHQKKATTQVNLKHNLKKIMLKPALRKSVFLKNALTHTVNAYIELTVKKSVCVGSGQEHVENALDILYLSENFEHNEIMSTEIGNCDFYIDSVQPEYFRDIFSIDRTTGFLKSKKFDREHKEFNLYTVPQFQLKLKLHCGPNNSFPITRMKRNTGYRPMIVVDQIPFSTDITFLNIVIVDENDNAPIFIHPTTKHFLLGYPDPSLAIQILPLYLIVVEAYDIDEGLNAVIKYSIAENPHFTIDPKSGVIYPLKNCMKDMSEVNLTVKATDKYGGVDGLFSYIDLTVKKIRKENLGVLTINNQDLSKVEGLIVDIRNKTNMNLMIINFAAVPSEDLIENSKKYESLPRHEFLRQSPEKQTDVQIKMFVYAFNKDEQLMTREEITNILKNSNLTYDIEELKPVNYSLEPVDTPWFISTIVLAVILVLFLITTGFVLLYCQRYRRIQRRISDSNRKLEEDFNKGVEVDSPVPILKNPQRQNGVDVVGTTNNESTTDENMQLAKSLEQILNVRKLSDIPNSKSQNSPNGEKKKNNVTFNELVERIEVIADVENENDHEHINKTSYDQRL